MIKVISRHFTATRAHRKANQLNAAPQLGRSSGWSRIDYSVRTDFGSKLKKFCVVERTL